MKLRKMIIFCLIMELTQSIFVHASTTETAEAAQEPTTENTTTKTTEETKPAPKPGWNRINGKYYFYNSKLVMMRNTIVYDKSTGYRYVDNSGARVDDKNIQAAVNFVTKYTKPGWSKSKKLKTCCNKILKKYKFKNMGDISKFTAKNMQGRARYFMKKKKGDCVAHASAFCTIARVIGYDSRVMKGVLNRKYKKTTYVSDHCYAEVKKGKKWYIYDLTFKRRAPKRKFANVTTKGYHKNFKVKKKKYFNLVVSNGISAWK